MQQAKCFHDNCSFTRDWPVVFSSVWPVSFTCVISKSLIHWIQIQKQVNGLGGCLNYSKVVLEQTSPVESSEWLCCRLWHLRVQFMEFWLKRMLCSKEWSSDAASKTRFFLCFSFVFKNLKLKPFWNKWINLIWKFKCLI